MSGQYPGTGPRRGTGPARHRWAASLGPARGEGLLDAGLDAGPDGGARDEGAASGGAAAGFPAAGIRWRTGRRAAVLLAVIAVLLGGWFWWQAADGTPRVQPLGGPPGAEPAAGSGAAGSGSQPVHDGGPADTAGPGAADVPGTGAGGTIVVHVAGAVASPGVLQLPPGSRLHEAVTAAGGSTDAADLDRLNLAAVLEDGQKILVPELGSPDPEEPAGPSAAAGGTGTAGGTGPPAGKINLNTAGVEELATLPRVGPVLAQRIVDWRRQHGRFGSVEELDAVEGVGPKLLEALVPLVRV